jgi:hypothetical protein
MDERENLLDSFLERWSLERVAAMNLSEYVDVGNKDTFCQWIETRTRPLGSIKGSTSRKFGIFKRKKKPERASSYFDDGEYTWSRRYGDTRSEAFGNIKREILQIIQYALSGDFELIDAISLPNMFKWKIAFLYSNERLIPIYEIETLENIGEALGIDKLKPDVSEIQRSMIHNKPANKTIYEYMEDLWFRFNSKGSTRVARRRGNLGENQTNGVHPSKRRHAATKLDLDSQTRTVSRSFIVEKKHNMLQQALYNSLCEEFGERCVFLEEDFVDVKLVNDETVTLYEVKSSSYAGLCIREALGQLLFYALQLDDPREKKLVVVGQYPLNHSEEQLLTTLKDHLGFDLSYQHIALG